jgi:hypothetical protein
MTLIVIVNENSYHPLMSDKETRALLAGTLALMTHFAESRCPSGAERIRENLLRLCAMRDLPWEFRATLAKLGARWTQLQLEPVTSLARPSALH